jgi:hypothetical protein
LDLQVQVRLRGVAGVPTLGHRVSGANGLPLADRDASAPKMREQDVPGRSDFNHDMVSNQRFGIRMADLHVWKLIHCSNDLATGRCAQDGAECRV